MSWLSELATTASRRVARGFRAKAKRRGSAIAGINDGAIFGRFLNINPQSGVKNHTTASAARVKVAEFCCYLLVQNRKVMAIETIHALAPPRAVTKGILAMVAR